MSSAKHNNKSSECGDNNSSGNSTKSNGSSNNSSTGSSNNNEAILHRGREGPRVAQPGRGPPRHDRRP